MTFIHFIGIDISKKTFDVGLQGLSSKSTKKFTNDPEGIAAFMCAYSEHLPKALVVLECTGGYETGVVSELVLNNIAVHVADPLTAKHFIRSLGKRAKTDALDAMALARYGHERHTQLTLYQLMDANQVQLKALMARRYDLIAMRKAELCRHKHPNYCFTFKSVDNLLNYLNQDIAEIENRMRAIIAQSPKMKAILKVLLNMQGVGEKTALALLACFPELGKVARRQAASLAGCAPHPRDSGNTIGYRRTIGGRAIIKQSLFMAAMAARNFHPILKAFYLKLIQNGKKPIVALTAIMRKLIVILNAKIRDQIYSLTW